MSALLKVMRNDGYKPPAVVQGPLDQKLKAAKEWMGSKWVHHPDYQFNPKHRIYNMKGCDEGNCH